MTLKAHRPWRLGRKFCSVWLSTEIVLFLPRGIHILCVWVFYRRNICKYAWKIIYKKMLLNFLHMGRGKLCLVWAFRFDVYAQRKWQPLLLISRMDAVHHQRGLRANILQLMQVEHILHGKSSYPRHLFHIKHKYLMCIWKPLDFFFEFNLTRTLHFRTNCSENILP